MLSEGALQEQELRDAHPICQRDAGAAAAQHLLRYVRCTRFCLSTRLAALHTRRKYQSQAMPLQTLAAL